MQKSVCEINGSIFINLSSKYHSRGFQYHIVLTSPIQLPPCFRLSVHQRALESRWEVLLLVRKYTVRMMTEIIQYLAFLPYLHNEQRRREKHSYYLMSKRRVKDWFFRGPHPDDNMRQIPFGYIRENPNSKFSLISEIFGEITSNFHRLGQITPLSKLRQITLYEYGS